MKAIHRFYFWLSRKTGRFPPATEFDLEELVFLIFIWAVAIGALYPAIRFLILVFNCWFEAFVDLMWR